MPSPKQKHAACRLRDAVGAGHMGMVAALLDDGADPNTDLEGSLYPLELAASRGQFDMVRLLLAHGAEVGLRSLFKFTTFQMACMGGHLSIAQELLAAGANINETCKDGRTALSLLARNDGVENGLQVLKMLICVGASMDIRDSVGCAAIHEAAGTGHVSALQELTAAGSSHAWRNNGFCTPLALACFGGHLRCVNYLLDICGADPGVVDGGGYTPLSIAVEKGHTAVVGALLRFGDYQLGPNAYPDALCRAVTCKRTNMLTMLLSADGRMHVNGFETATGMSPLHFSALCSHPISTSMILEAGGDETAVNRRGEIPFDMVDMSCKLPGATDILIATDMSIYFPGPVAQQRVRLMLKQAPAYRARSWRWPDASPACAVSLTTAPAELTDGETGETTTKRKADSAEMIPEDFDNAFDVAMAVMTTSAMTQKVGVRMFRRTPITLGGLTTDGHPMVVAGLVRYARKF